MTRPGHTHFVGIGGAGMSSLAAVLLDLGQRVSGCDRQPGPSTEALERRGVMVYTGHSPEHLRGVTRVVVTGPAASSDEVQRARGSGLSVLLRAELLGQLMAERRGLAIAGTHGKTTTTSLAAAMLLAGDLDPTVLIGGVPAGWTSGGRAGRGEWLVAEADEYARSFHYLHPEVAIVTGVELDHPDIYPDLGAVVEAFEVFLRGMRPGGKVLVAASSSIAVELASRVAVATDLQVETYGTGPGADWRAVVRGAGESGTRFDVEHASGPLTDLRLRMPGRHNVENATVAVAAARTVGV
ncbi:MAG: Mur ligase domain-containing protein, partial [Chloroflexota bacterium]|nr:Mur ligase domain-containing protein [Chloroflexota bacterium]